MAKIFQRLLLLIIQFYQKLISPLLPARCRYYPTCSQYGKQAIRWHGARIGGWLTVKRICRCHPWGGHGIDFVPLPLYQWQFVPIWSWADNYVYVDRASYRAVLSVWINRCD